MDINALISAHGSSIVVFIIALFFFVFFEDLTGIRGFFRVFAAAVVTWLFDSYGHVVWNIILDLMRTYGLGDLIR
ncbi:MAG: hypothetical protein ACQEQV_10325 [Fibrobacterota bacterium]